MDLKEIKRRRSPSSDSSTSAKRSRRDSNSKGRKRERSKEKSNGKRRSRDSSSSSSSDSDDRRKRKERRKKKKELKRKKKEKKKTKKEKKKAEKSLNVTSNSSNVAVVSPPSKSTSSNSTKKADQVFPEELLEKRKIFAPMSKEEWEKKQSVIRREFDPISGRTRLIKGDGEVMEEIVSRERQKVINKSATSTDANYFASTIMKMVKK